MKYTLRTELQTLAMLIVGFVLYALVYFLVGIAVCTALPWFCGRSP